MTWTGQTFTAGQILTATQLNNLQADITAQANGDTGAPKNALASMDSNSVDTAQIVANAVTQGKIATSMSEVSDATAGPTLLTLPGGEYGFYPQVKSSASSEHEMQICHGTTSTSYATRISIDRQSGTGTGYAQQRYVTASPPYDLGDGPIPLFIFLKIDKTTKEILSTYIAPEAPWHNNGPTVIRPDGYGKRGVPYRWVTRVPPGLEQKRTRIAEIQNRIRTNDAITDRDRMDLRDFYESVKNEPRTRVPVTQVVKNADMTLLPHPFDVDASREVAILLDPMSPLTETMLHYLNEEGSGFELTNLFKEGFLTFGNTPLNRAGPDGVIQVAYDWRKTA